MMIDLKINQLIFKNNKLKSINSINNYMKKIIKLNLKNIKIKNKINLKKELINLTVKRKHSKLIKKLNFKKGKK